MTAARIASFAESPAGQVYGRICERWGNDPAAGIDDDVLAYNMRFALAISGAANSEPELTPDGSIRYDGGIS